MARPPRDHANPGQAPASAVRQGLQTAIHTPENTDPELSLAGLPESGHSAGSQPGKTENLENSLTQGPLAGNKRDVLVALTYGLELARHGAMLVAGEGQPQLANRTALAILEKKDGIALARTGLVADRASDTRLLHRLLQEAISSPHSGEPHDSPLTLPRRKAHSALIVRVVPGPGVSCWNGPTALLKLYDQDMSVIVDERALSSLYGLTRGEAALAALLVQGQSIEDAAGQLFISTHTARTHLKRIFMKTDTHRQTELVVRMMLTVL